MPGGLDILIFDKNSTEFHIFNLGAWSLVWGSDTTNPPLLPMGLDQTYCRWVTTSLVVWLQQLIRWTSCVGVTKQLGE